MQRIEKDFMGNSAVCPATINLDCYLGSGGGGGGRSQLPDVRSLGHVRNRQTINGEGGMRKRRWNSKESEKNGRNKTRIWRWRWIQNTNVIGFMNG